MNTYIVNFNPEIDLSIFRKIRNEFLGTADFPASSLVGIALLGYKNWLIKFEAIAIVD